MATSVLEQFRISDFLAWHHQKALHLNPFFQRRAVWTSTAKILLIDTILRQFPVPKIYMRTRVDIVTKKASREIVDGQQRLRAIFEFADDQMTLSRRANEFSGFKYSTLPDDLKEIFLSYPIAVQQLVNASDADVLEVFSRLNSYNVSLNAAELRHAKYQGEFKWAVHTAARDWSVLWDKYGVVSTRQRLRMLDDSFMAEMFGVLLEGVKDGGQAKINTLYKNLDPRFKQEEEVREKLDAACGLIVKEFDDILTQDPSKALASAPQFLMLFAAVSHAIFGIPAGNMGDAMPDRDQDSLRDIDQVKENLTRISLLLVGEIDDQGFEQFVRASQASTQRILGRRIRFPVFYRALLPHQV